jgi:hypothetical protein
MTTDQLERDLKTLAAPQAHDEHVRLSIRAALGERLQPRPRRRSRKRLALGAVALGAATVAAALAALIGTGGSGGISTANAAILAHVTQAINPTADIIVHVKETGALADGTPVQVEWWQQTNAPHALRLIKGEGNQLGDGGSDGTTAYQYDAATNTIYEHPESKTPTLIDPLETVRAELANGSAQVAGTVTIDGQSLYKIALPTGVVGYFDQSDYRPAYVDNPTDGGTVRTKVVTYEELPLTPANEKLLSVKAQHPGATVEVVTARKEG